VLVVSTDPAHSLGDALGVKLGASPRAIRRGLTAVELDAPRAFARWIGQHGAALGEALEHGTWLDRADVDALLDLSLPGIDELVGILEIARLANSRRYDHIVVDTAPTGHTLRLLASPQTVSAVAGILDALQAEHRLIREQLARVGRPEAADRLIELLAEQARETGAMLRDRHRTTFCWVTLPEALSLAESEDGLAALETHGMHAAQIIVNRVLPAAGPCPVCDRRRADQRRVVAQIKRRLGRGRRLTIVPAELREPRGLAALAKIGTKLSTTENTGDTEENIGVAPRVSRGVERVPFALSAPKGARTVSPESLDVLRGAKLVFVGGKGGVGKTTVSTAAAVRLARAHPDRRMLLLSTDPAHSIADVLEARNGAIGDTPTRVRGGPANLLVRELDAARALAGRRVALEHALDEIADSFGADASAGGPRGAAELMDLAPPGVDELFGVLEVFRLTASPRGGGAPRAREYDVIIVDTAPTGHALRLLELPDAAREWVQVLLRMLLKYKSLVRPGQLAAELVDVSKSIRELQTILRDGSHTRFLVVTRAAEVPRFETERLLTRLRRLKLAVPAVIVNAMTLAPGRCVRCRATAAAERRSLAALRRRCGARSSECVIIQTPLSAPPPRGVRALDRWAERWLMAER
jgi:arsenite-transporting ATPase